QAGVQALRADPVQDPAPPETNPETARAGRDRESIQPRTLELQARPGHRGPAPAKHRRFPALKSGEALFPLAALLEIPQFARARTPRSLLSRLHVQVEDSRLTAPSRTAPCIRYTSTPAPAKPSCNSRRGILSPILPSALLLPIHSAPKRRAEKMPP